MWFLYIFRAEFPWRHFGCAGTAVPALPPHKRHLVLPRDLYNLTIMGDRLPVSRLGVTNARVRTDAVWFEVEDALMDLAIRRWPIRLWAVRRHLNKAADALATLGVLDS